MNTTGLVLVANTRDFGNMTVQVIPSPDIVPMSSISNHTLKKRYCVGCYYFPIHCVPVSLYKAKLILVTPNKSSAWKQSKGTYFQPSMVYLQFSQKESNKKEGSFSSNLIPLHNIFSIHGFNDNQKPRDTK